MATSKFCAETYRRTSVYRSGSHSVEQTVGEGNDFINVESNAFARIDARPLNQIIRVYIYHARRT